MPSTLSWNIKTLTKSITPVDGANDVDETTSTAAPCAPSVWGRWNYLTLWTTRLKVVLFNQRRNCERFSNVLDT